MIDDGTGDDNRRLARRSEGHLARRGGQRGQRGLARRTEFAPPDLFLPDLDLPAVEADSRSGWEDELEENDGTPSLPVILVSAACGVGGGILGFYLAYVVFVWSIEWVAATTTLALLFSLGLSGALMSAATGSRSAPANILFSCGLIVGAALFIGLCLVVGALGATLLVRL